MSTQVSKRLFTVEEYHQMAKAGILSEDDRVELIKGEIVEVPPIGSQHAACVNRLTRLFSQWVGERAIVSVQNPIYLSEHSELQPDLALLRPRSDFYAQAHPQPQDVLPVVEVADTPLTYDREVKIPLYAKSGIPEVWLVDLTADCIEVYQKPSPQGYLEIKRFQCDQNLFPQAFPDVGLAVQDILG
ncbi:MAG TPA: Uma2 family endonuclease [Candidatus Limnocylindrales bacterium]|nr:Uma2 family endonuclease [Candidatus Limnocylindrales bacterium]